MNDDEELVKWREKRGQEVLTQQQMHDDQENKYHELKENVLRQILTPEAKARLARIRLVKPQLAEQIDQQLITLAQSGRLPDKIDDETFVQILSKIIPKQKEMKIQRVG